MTLRIDSSICRDLDVALTREWLATNGLGGYASGTVAGVNTRRYHGLLVAAITPPVQRMVLLAALEEWLLVGGGEPRSVSAQEYWDGTVYPDGYRNLDGVEVEGMLPCFRWTIDGHRIEKRIWMDHDANRTVIRYRLVDGPEATLQLRPLFAHRDYHQQRHGQAAFDIAETTEGWIVEAQGVRSYLAARPAPAVRSRADWYWRILHRAERERGLDDEEDLFTPGVVELALNAGTDVVLIVGTEPIPLGWECDASQRRAEERQAAVLDPGIRNPIAIQLAIAAEQFRVTRLVATPHPNPPPQRGREDSQPQGGREDQQRTVIAGYHWFTDWGRDSMISLPGLAMRPGTLWEARAVLDTNIRYLNQGLIPNRFPDSGEAPEYNTMDATLWMFQAVAAYLRASGDWRFLAERLDAIESIIDWHVRGTYHNIRMDEHDGLLAGGEEGYAITWMDARVQDWVVTPRYGKPIEINALWFNALRLTADWCERAGRPAGRYRAIAAQVMESAERRFWHDDGYFFDVVDGPEGNDPSLRPNQVIAMALIYPLLQGHRAKDALEVVSRKLLTPYGLRTLSPDDERYQPAYRGDQRARDAAYHMGMAWPWLMGPYLDAHLRIHGDREVVSHMVEPFRAHLWEGGIGSISEIFEPEPPYRPVGCIAQAWSVGEILRHAATLP